MRSPDLCVTLTLMDANREKLGQLMVTRRQELGRTQEWIEETFGVSTETLSKYERGEIPTRPTRRIVNALEEALDWTSGSIAAVLEGGEPTAGETNERIAKIRETAAGDPDAAVKVRRLIRAIRDASLAAADAAHAAAEIPDLPQRTQDEIRELHTLSATLLVSAIAMVKDEEGMAETLAALLETRNRKK